MWKWFLLALFIVIGGVTILKAVDPNDYTKTEVESYWKVNKLPNGTKDEILDNGFVLQNVGKIVLNGTENWVLSSTFIEHISFAVQNVLTNSGIVSSDTNTAISNYFNQNSEYYLEESFRSAYINNQGILINIRKDRLTSVDVNGFKLWLQSNNLEIYYELQDPTMINGIYYEWAKLHEVVDNEEWETKYLDETISFSKYILTIFEKQANFFIGISEKFNNVKDFFLMNNNNWWENLKNVFKRILIL